MEAKFRWSKSEYFQLLHNASPSSQEYSILGYCNYCQEWIPWGLPCWLSVKESACQSRSHRFDPWSGKISHAAEQRSPWATTIRLCPRAQKQQLLSPCAATTARAPWSLCLATREASTVRRMHTAARVQTLLSAAEKDLRSSEDPGEPKINK